MKRLMAVLALCVVLGWSSAALAQCCGCQTAYYAPAPVTTYYAPATAYYAPAPTTVYYAPTTAYYAPAPIVQTRYRPILGGTVTRVYYPNYAPAYPTIAYYRY
jgi:hypothetical protein